MVDVFTVHGPITCRDADRAVISPRTSMSILGCPQHVEQVPRQRARTNGRLRSTSPLRTRTWYCPFGIPVSGISHRNPVTVPVRTVRSMAWVRMTAIAVALLRMAAEQSKSGWAGAVLRG